MVLGVVALLVGIVGWWYWRWRSQSYLDAYGLAADPEQLAGLLRKSVNSFYIGVGAAVVGFMATAVLRYVWSRSSSGGSEG
jgi:ABC-type Fe3+ transport system permease subunit